MVVFDILKTGAPLVFRSKIGAASRFHKLSDTVVKLGQQLLLEDMFCGALARQSLIVLPPTIIIKQKNDSNKSPSSITERVRVMVMQIAAVGSAVVVRGDRHNCFIESKMVTLLI